MSNIITRSTMSVFKRLNQYMVLFLALPVARTIITIWKYPALYDDFVARQESTTSPWLNDTAMRPLHTSVTAALQKTADSQRNNTTAVFNETLITYMQETTRQELKTGDDTADTVVTIQSALVRPRLNSTTIVSMNISATIPDSVEVFYTGTRGDRAGAVIMDMLMAHAFAWTLGRKYGGMCGPIHPSAEDHRRMIKVLGLEDELPYPAQPEPCEHFDGSGGIGMMVHRSVYMDWKDSEIFTPEWTEYIQQRRKLPPPLELSAAVTRPTNQLQEKYKQQHRILVHIRRGDVTPCINDYTRYTPNAHYFHLINNLARENNNDTFYNVTIYSESDSFESWQDFNYSHQANVACHLALDGDMGQVWKDMLGYDDNGPLIHRTLVLSSSTFSFVPALLANPSTTTVIYTPYWHKPLPQWQVVGSETTTAALTNTLWLRQQYCSEPRAKTPISSAAERIQVLMPSGLSRPRWSSSTIAAMNISMTIPDSVQVFYSAPRGDRSGSAVLDMLNAHAFAWTLGRKYGGVCGPIYAAADDHRRMIQVLGLEDELPYPLEPPSCASLEGSTTNILVPRTVYMDWKNSDIFTPEWVEYIQQRQRLPSPRVSSPRPKRLLSPTAYLKQERVVIHIRRGDVTPCMDDFTRYTPNAHYYHLINNYARENNDTFYNVTIYSESDSFESWQDFNYSHQPNVACRLALDGDMGQVWKDMLGYDDNHDPSIHRTLVLSFSTFSFVPALLANQSTTTVIYTPYWHKPLPHWQVVGSETTAAARTNTLYLRQAFCSPK